MIFTWRFMITWRTWLIVTAIALMLTIRGQSCTCITMFRDKNCFDQLLEKLEKYESKDTEGRKLFLHGVLTHGNLKKEDLKRGAKRSSIYALTGVKTIEGETVFVCSTTLKNLFCIGNKQWKILQTDAHCTEDGSLLCWTRLVQESELYFLD